MFLTLTVQYLSFNSRSKPWTIFQSGMKDTLQPLGLPCALSRALGQNNLSLSPSSACIGTLWEARGVGEDVKPPCALMESLRCSFLVGLKLRSRHAAPALSDRKAYRAAIVSLR